MNMSLPAAQRGLSLIELMIALAIGSFLVVGITQIFIDNRRSYSFQQSEAGNIESARFTEIVLNNYLSKAGYRRSSDQDLEFAFPASPAGTDCSAFTAGNPITTTLDAQGICIRYQPVVSGEPDCEGNASTAFKSPLAPFPEITKNNLIVLAIKYFPAGATVPSEATLLDYGSLRCKSINSTASSGYTELLDGIADFRLEFGVGTNDLFGKQLRNDANRFVKAADWNAAIGPIRAVRYSVLLSSTENKRDGDSKIYSDWYASADAAAQTRLTAGEKGRTYQLASSTQNLRNLMP
ncbi:MAG: PilW family protein [Pseudomonas sp.]|uniref:PilW family protein n=1 Tax=Pseudomonas sp. TaxID=306 RepID=UPI003396F396